MYVEFVSRGSNRQILLVRTVRNVALNQRAKVPALKTGETISLQNHAARNYDAASRLLATWLHRSDPLRQIPFDDTGEAQHKRIFITRRHHL